VNAVIAVDLLNDTRVVKAVSYQNDKSPMSVWNNVHMLHYKIVFILYYIIKNLVHSRVAQVTVFMSKSFDSFPQLIWVQMLIDSGMK